MDITLKTQQGFPSRGVVLQPCGGEGFYALVTMMVEGKKIPFHLLPYYPCLLQATM